MPLTNYQYAMEAKPMKILVIDREPIMRKYIMSCVLQCGNYEFVEIKDFSQILRSIHENKPLVIIFDLIQAFGNDMARIIESARNISLDYFPYFIAFSSVDDSEKIAFAFDSGLDFYLPKKFSNYHVRGILKVIMGLDNSRSRIRENECYYATMFKKAGDAVLIVGLPEMDIYDANPQTTRIYGYCKHELLSMKFGQLTENFTVVKEKLLKKATFLMNVNQKRKQGEIFPASLALAYFERNRKPLVIITVKDIGEAKRQQEEKDALLAFKRIESEKSGSEIFAVLRGEQNERRRISRDIHDHIGQQLVSIKLELENQAVHAEHQTYRSNILSLRDQMVSAISSLRKLSSNIAGDYLPQSDWVESVRVLIENLTRKNKIKIALNAHQITPNLSVFVHGHIYRIIEESLTNALKHSEKKKAFINIKPEGKKSLLVQIISLGIAGKSESKLTPGIGMRIIYQRARLIKANLLFEVNGREEFIVHLRVPLSE